MPAALSRNSKHIFSFGNGQADGDRDMLELLGGKGANLAEMSNLGLPVPPGFTVSTDVCSWYYDHGLSFPPRLEQEVDKALANVESSMGKRFGDPDDPLLLSVRSGARISMPGMMDTVLNLGLNDETVEGLAKRTGNERFAWDAYRRFVQMYGNVVMGIGAESESDRCPFGEALDALKLKRRVKEDTQLKAQDLKQLVQSFKTIVKKRTNRKFPEDPTEQLWGAIGAVFGSWNNERAIAYRAMHQIPGKWGTAVTIMAMVFGNMGDSSGTGVAFTRDPSSGEKKFYGEYLMNAQGEDVVAGIRTPLGIEHLRKSSPKAWRELQRIQKLLESHYRDMQDLEFTIEEGRLFMLQCRNGKRTGFAALRIATDLVREKVITRDEALMRIDPESLNQLLQPVFTVKELAAAKRSGSLIARGLPAGPGAASGRIVFSAGSAVEWAARGEQVILVRIETSPEDIKGMQAAMGILTARGGMTSHAALIARQMGKVCVAGSSDLEIDYKKRSLRVLGKTFKQGDWISLDGTAGRIYKGQINTAPSEVMAALFGKGERAKRKRRGKVYQGFKKLMAWADEVRTLGVRTNADQADQCKIAVAFGAEGIGLCRTEHMFFGAGKIEQVREMILADSQEKREDALKRLLPIQRKDFEAIFKSMEGRPVTVRTLDPPLHEFLPHEPAAIKRVAADLGVPQSVIKAKVEHLTELNPMLGHRGCRLGIAYPEITRMQTRAIFEAACNVARKTGVDPRPEIMIPLISTAEELRLQAAIVRQVAEEVFERKRRRIPYLLGTMIELPRAALTAGEIAEEADFFSFGTNDLTQTTYGISRDDAGKFVPLYIELGVFPGDPFATIDPAGVGRLMQIATIDGRATRPDLKLGICGEHGGEPASILFCHQLGLAYVSCSPYRIPIARLAAAQAVITSRI
ncbi:MAG: pyruvate,orthophosphate dikinase [Candidatus Paceibacteria bacterium]|jgi:pyruvate,orthophosphate dikinase